MNDNQGISDIIANSVASYIVVYKNKKFLIDAIRSVTSLNAHMPGLRTTLFTDINPEDIPQNSFSTIKTVPSPLRHDHSNDIWTTKYECMLNSNARYNLILDADTFVCGEISDVFQILDNFDFASPMSICHISRDLPGIPNCFPEFGGGVIAWRNCVKMRSLFSCVLKLLKSPNRRGSDEPSLRTAVYENDVRFAVLPWEYNCSYIHPGYLFSDVKIIHGRYADLETAAKLINMPIKKSKHASVRVTGGGKLVLYESVRHRKYKIYKEISIL